MKFGEKKLGLYASIYGSRHCNIERALYVQKQWNKNLQKQDNIISKRKKEGTFAFSLHMEPREGVYQSKVEREKNDKEKRKTKVL